MRARRHARTDSADRKVSNSVAIILMSVLLLLSVGAAFAFADETTDQPTASFLPSDVDSAAELAPLIADSEPVDVEADTDPAVAEELPHTDLNRTEAEELLEGVFGADEVEASAEFFDALDIEAFRSDNVALVAPAEPGAEPGLLFSTLPLRTADESGEEAPVDLGLEANEGSLEPANPLVQVQIPTQLAEGISLPEAGVTVELAGGAIDRSSSELGDASAFYPNVAADTDFVVAAAPTGFETYTHLRSPEAPTQQKFDIGVPAGAELRATNAGGAEVVLPNGSIPLTVSAPAAVDAEGSDVPVTLEVEGDSVVLSANPGPDAAFPILVDPIFDIYNFTSASSQGTQGKPWVGAYTGKQVYYNWGSPKYGMNTGALAGPTTPGSNAWFNVYVPRYFTDPQAGLGEPTSYIKSLKLWYLTFNMPYESQPANERPAYPSMQMGLWGNGQFAAYGQRLGNEGAWTDLNYVFDLKNPNENTNVKNGGFGIGTWASYNVADRYVNVQQASVELTDQDSPELDFLGSAGGSWMNATALGKIPYLATDPGLGIYTLKLKQPNAEGGSQVISTSNGGCVGTAQSPCPRESKEATRAITYNPQSMAQGENMVEVTATDPLNHVSPPGLTTKIKVDHTAPALSLTGNLTEQPTAGTNLREYTLSYTAKDGDEAAAAALTPWGTAGKAEKQLERPMGVSIAADGSIYAVDRVNNRVIKYDTEGKPALQFGSTGSGDGQFNDPRGIDIAPDGTVWVADMGNDRIQAFSPTGTFLRKAKFTDPASEPYAIASGPGGVLWVTDIGLKRLIKLSENPITTLLITSGKEPGGNGKGTAVISPTGVATDKFGNVWIADGGLGKVLELDSAGKPRFEFGTSGPGDGQIDGIVGIDVSPCGNIAITERNNGRVQIFKPDGSYLRKFGSAGAGNNQFFEAGGLSFGPNNMLAVADAGNKRVTRWSHADLEPQSGVAKVEVKVDGQSKHGKLQTCGTKNCSLSGSWTLDADDYAGGAHKVEVKATDAVGISQMKTIDIETHGDHTDPAIALSGTMTQQSSIGTTRPTYKLKAVSTDSGPATELNSGVASTVIKVDGAVVDSSSPGCPAGGCSITREWTLNSNTYSVGSHTVEVKATDAAGRSTTKTLTIDIAEDKTAPEVSYMGALYSAPSGWLEQKKIGYSVFATDAGYGVTSIELKVDGAAVNSTTQTCSAGGCSKFFALSETLDVAKYSGGAHPAEFIARDGAGNIRKRTWTINVVPSGDISKSETIKTLEAADETSGANTVGSSEEGEEAELAMGGEVLFEEVEEHTGFVAPDAAAPVFVGIEADEAIEIQIPADRVTEEPCPLVEQPLIEEGPAEPVPDEERPESCPEEAYGEELIEKETLTITPLQTSPEATTVGLDPDAAAAVTANVQTNVDQLVRPIYNGTHTFTAIRDAAAPQEFSWRVRLEEDQTLEQIDSQNAVVRWDSGHTAFSITATKAHDAIGTNVPTGISVAGNVLTLYVQHRQPSPVGGNYVYPVTAGAGWQGGFQTYQVVMPPPTEQEQQEEVGEPIENVEFWENEKEGRIKLLSASAPVFAGNAEGGKKKYEYKFRWSECRYSYADKSDVINKPRRVQLQLYVGGCADRTTPMIAGHTVFGWVHMIPGDWIWVNQDPRNIHCETWGHLRGAPVNCFARPWKAKSGITLRGDFRLGPDTIGTFHVAECLTMHTEVFSSKPWVVMHENITSYAGADQFFEPCKWPG